MTSAEMESAIRGLMILGRTREEAVAEIHRNEMAKDSRSYDDMMRALYDDWEAENKHRTWRRK